MTLRDLLGTDVQNVVLNTEDLAESITYDPKGADPAVTINAVVRRLDAEPDSRDESEYVAFRTVRIIIANHATKGVVKPKEGDKITAILRAGQSAQEGRVVGIVATNEGRHILEVSA